MTEDKRQTNISIIRHDTNEQLLDRYVWYIQNFNPIDEDRCEHYELVKAEILRRMSKEEN